MIDVTTARPIDLRLLQRDLSALLPTAEDFVVHVLDELDEAPEGPWLVLSRQHHGRGARLS